MGLLTVLDKRNKKKMFIECSQFKIKGQIHTSVLYVDRY